MKLVRLFHSGWLRDFVNTRISMNFFSSGSGAEAVDRLLDSFSISEMPELSHYRVIHKIEGVFTYLHIIVYGFNENTGADDGLIDSWPPCFLSKRSLSMISL